MSSINRETKSIKLSTCEVELYKEPLWIEKQEIEAVLIGGAKMDNTGINGYDPKAMLDSKIKAMEMLIVEITASSGEKLKFSSSWLNGLSVSDGDLLSEEIDASFKKK